MRLDGGFRYYQTSRARTGVLFLYAYLAAGAGTVILLSGPHKLVVAVIAAVAFVDAVVWGERVTIKTGLEERPEGFIDHTNLGSRVLPLEAIERFTHRRGLGVERVLVVRRGGAVGDPIQGLVQGRRMVWNGGETRDIVAVLNERLQEMRAEATLQP